MLVNSLSPCYSPKGVFSFLPETGAISSLFDALTNVTWASPAAPLALVHYQTYDSEAFTSFLSTYSLCQLDQFCALGLQDDFGKPLLDLAHPTQQLVTTNVSSMYMQVQANGTQFHLQLTFADTLLHTLYGAPDSFWLSVFVPNSSSETSTTGSPANISLEVRWINKTTTRMPEAIWLRFDPPVASPSAALLWEMDKLGQWISPSEVILNGSRHLHAINSGIRVSTTLDASAHQMRIYSADCALVNAGIYSFNFHQRDSKGAPLSRGA